MAGLVGALDQGTTSTRFMVFDRSGSLVSSHRVEHRQILPRPGWVEHDPVEIAEQSLQAARAALDAADLGPDDLAAFGIANQRETVLAWDRETGRPLGNAIVWQDTRTDAVCRDLAGQAGHDRFRARTGLPIATYFSGPKLAWMLEHRPGLRARAEAGEVAFGTVDSWLVWNLTGGALHVTDVTNASRTLLMDLETLSWDPHLCDAMGVPIRALPRIRPSVTLLGDASGPLAGVPIGAVLGDQQAALLGQACFRPGEVKNTYGTGNFMLLNTGERIVRSKHGLLTTVACQVDGAPATYALEGSIGVTGDLVRWLRDGLGIIRSSDEVEALAASVDDNGDVYVVPAFSGLFAPHWRPDARGAIVGLTAFANRGHLARAALEAAAFQSRDVLEAMLADSGGDVGEMRVDGGMVANGLLMQFQADLLGIPVVRPAFTETTALGAAYGAGLAAGVWASPDEVRHHWREGRRWEPAMGETERRRLVSRWSQAVERSFGWV